MSTLDYVIRLRRKSEHEMLAELLDFGLTHKVLRPEQREEAEGLMKETLGRLLMRKTLKPDDAQRLLARFGKYLT